MEGAEWGVPGPLIDLGLGLLAVGLTGMVFYLLAPRIYGLPLREGAIKPTVATLGAVASVVAGLRWLV